MSTTCPSDADTEDVDEIGALRLKASGSAPWRKPRDDGQLTFARVDGQAGEQGFASQDDRSNDDKI